MVSLMIVNHASFRATAAVMEYHAKSLEALFILSNTLLIYTTIYFRRFCSKKTSPFQQTRTYDDTYVLDYISEVTIIKG